MKQGMFIISLSIISILAICQGNYQDIEKSIHSGRFEEAEYEINIQFDQDSLNSMLYYYKGLVFDSLRQDDYALLNYKKSISIDSNLIDPYFAIGELYYRQAHNYIIQFKYMGYPEDEVKAIQSKQNHYFIKALPFYEKAFIINNNDSIIKHRLIESYSRLNMKELLQKIKK